jgi:hypothetical protein
MNRAIVLAGVLGFVALAASPASAAPSNKNVEVIEATCDGQAITVSVVHKKNENADLVSAGPVIGGGATVVKTFTVYEAGTTNVLFSAVSHYGGPTNAECTGTASEGGQTFDFVAEVHLTGV